MIVPGLTAVTQPRARGLHHIEVGPQDFAVLIYIRRSREFVRPPLEGVRETVLPKNTVMHIPPGMPSIWTYPEPMWDRGKSLHCLHLRLTQEFEDVLERPLDLQGTAPSARLGVSGLAHWMERTLARFETGVPGDDLALQSSACAAAARFFDPMFRSPSPGADSFTARRRKLLHDYVEANLASRISLADMAAQLSLSPWHFLRIFKAATGETPHAWITRLRIARIKSQLTGGDLSLRDVAALNGFSTQSHMSATFRRLTGVTPSQWRDDNRSTSRLVYDEDD